MAADITKREKARHLCVSCTFNIIHETILKKNVKPDSDQASDLLSIYRKYRVAEAGYPTTWVYGHKNSEYNKLF